MKKTIILAAVLLSINYCFADSNFNYQQDAQNSGFKPNYQTETYSLKNSNTLKGNIITVPAGQMFKAVLMAPVSSETAYNGQNITLALNSDFYYNGERIAPAGSSVTGTVIEASKAKHGTINGKLTLRFTQIITPTGITIPISALVKTDNNSGTLIGGSVSSSEYTKEVAVNSGSVGPISGQLSGSNAVRGAVLMPPVGTGGALVKSIWDKGADVEIPANAGIELILTQPITVNPAVIEN